MAGTRSTSSEARYWHRRRIGVWLFHIVYMRPLIRPRNRSSGNTEALRISTAHGVNVASSPSTDTSVIHERRENSKETGRSPASLRSRLAIDSLS